VDEYQDLLRVSIASAGNDHRLGANEAPPAIVSMFLGDELTEILEAIETGAGYKNKERQPMEIGVSVLPHFPKDIADRNRTSPFAFTGNKFEFRMLGSAFSIAGPNIVLNTIIAETLRQFADCLEPAANPDKNEGTQFTSELSALIKKTFSEHKRIIFNGNNYCEDWIIEAKKRGLSNLKATVKALPAYISKKSVELFSKHNVFTETEINSRYEIYMDSYCKTLHIEALTMIDMVKSIIAPACIDHQRELIDLLRQKKAYGGALNTSLEEHFLSNISRLSTSLLYKLNNLENVILESSGFRSPDIRSGEEILMQANFYYDKIFTVMTELRLVVDELETFVARKHWPIPTYAEILYSII
jgi:glutamine synthetase